jgi:1,4-dihydroxy-2-naphthoate polyprenyltransferase
VFSGGSGVLQAGTITPTALKRAAVYMALALVVWSAAALPRRPLLIVCAVAAIALLHAYSFAPLRLSIRGGGEWLQAAGVGIVLPVVGFYAQSGRLDLPAWALAVTVLTGLAGNLLTAVPDIETDARNEKRSVAVRYGERPTIILCAALLGSSVTFVYGSDSVHSTWAFVLAAATTVTAMMATVAGLTISDRTRARLGFVLLGGAAQHGLLLGWTAALMASN